MGKAKTGIRGVAIDWDEEPLQRWFGETVNPNTKDTYMDAWEAYVLYTGRTASQLLDEAFEDNKRDPREKKGILKRRLLGFNQWLRTDYPKRNTQGKIVGKGVASSTANVWFQSIRSFYGTFDLYEHFKGRSAPPKPRVTNKKLQLTAIDIKKLVDHARNPRDRAMILTMFQGGIDVSTLCSMKYKDVGEGLLKNELPLRLNLFRGKREVEYYTFLARDAVEAIKAYLNDLKSKDIVLKPNDPLFIQETTKKGKGEEKKEGLFEMTPFLVQKVMREVAVRSGLIDKENNGYEQNPVSPHALRKSFGKIMTSKGVPDTIVDFWLGHDIGDMAKAYKEPTEEQFEEIKQLYLDREQFISIGTLESQVVEQLRKETDERNKQLQTLVNGLATENIALKDRVQQLEKRMARYEAHVERTMKIPKPLEKKILKEHEEAHKQEEG